MLSAEEHLRRAAQRIERYSIPEPNSGCWLWLGAIGLHGYGISSFQNRNILAHRLSYILVHGNIPDGLQIDHLCRLRCCVNPNHLEPVTIAENLRRGIGQMPHEKCRRGHPLTPTNIVWDNSHRRRCKVCSRLRTEAFRTRRAETC